MGHYRPVSIPHAVGWLAGAAWYMVLAKAWMNAVGWSAEKIRAHAVRFGEARFGAEMRAFVEECLATPREARPAC